MSLKNGLNISICHTELTYGIWRLVLCIYGVFFIIFELDRLSFYCNYMEKSGSGIYYIEIYIYAFNKAICQRDSGIHNIQCPIY